MTPQITPIFSGDLISVLPSNNYTLSCPSWERLHHLLHQNILRESIGVMNFSSVTSWGTNHIILKGPMAIRDYSYSFVCAQNELTLQLQHHVEMWNFHEIS